MGLAKPLHLRLFLEGLEVPVISAQVQVNLWAPATASIQIVPLDSALDFKPRTMVHLFYLEEPKVTDTNKRVDLTAGLSTPLADNVYKILFCGEIVGFSFVKTPMSRAVILQCLDHSSYWDHLQATMMDYGPQGNAWVNKSAFYGSDSTQFANVPGQNQAEKLRSWILGKPTTPGWEKIGGLAGGILHMMEQMAGQRGWTFGVNDFYSLAELRCHLLSQVSAEEGDNTSQRLLSVQVFFDWLSSNMQNQSGQVSLRDMMKLLCQYIYYQIAPNPVAKYDPPDTKPRQITYGPKDVALSGSRWGPDNLRILKKCVKGLSPDNMGVTKSSLEGLGRDTTVLISHLKDPTLAAKIDQSLPAKAEDLQKAILATVAVWDKVPASLRETAQSTAHGVAQSLYFAYQTASSKPAYTQKGGSYEVSMKARFRTQIFRPDCYMAAPPTCNVIFPEQYSQLTYDRNFLNEATRVEISLYSKLVGPGNGLTAAHFMEPNLRGSSTEVVKHIGNKWRVLMDHEKHTGIIGKEEWLPDCFNLKQSSWTVTNEKGEKESVKAHLSWVTRTGLHHFFKYRIGPRMLNVAARFMPNVVCGFPALVLQRPFYSEEFPEDQSAAIDMILKSENPSVEFGAPPQFLGLVEGISHSIGQDGGLTQVSMSHGRNHLGIDDEFVGVVLARAGAEKTQKSVAHMMLSFSELEGKNLQKLEFLRRCTPQSPTALQESVVRERSLTKNEATFVKRTVVGGVSVSAPTTIAVTSTSERETVSSPTTTSDALSPVAPAGGMVKVPKLSGELSVGGKGPSGGRIKLIEVLDPAIQQRGDKLYFSKIVIYEEVTHSYQPTEPVPLEYVVQPAWLSESYDNHNVGTKVYQPFFGCNSIVDMISLSDIGSIPQRLGEKGLYVTVEEDQKKVEENLTNIQSKRNFYSIEKAVNLIAYLYGKVKSSESADVDEFVSTFVWRPVATKLDLLGSHNLKLKVEGDKVVKEDPNTIIGFHSLSVNGEVVKAGRLIGLLEDPTIALAKMKGALPEAIKASYDVRKEKLAKVEKYYQDMYDGNRGFQG